MGDSTEQAESKGRSRRAERARSREAVGKSANLSRVDHAAAASAVSKILSGPIRQKGVVTIPQQIRQALRLEEGDQVMFTVRDGSIVITPAALIPRDQAWFWTPEWQEKEAEADAEIAAGGGGEVYETGEDFIEGLKAV